MLAFVFVRAYIDYGTKGYAQDYNYTKPWHGIENPILIGIGASCSRRAHALRLGQPRDFFRPQVEVAGPTALEDPPAQTAVAME